MGILTIIAYTPPRVEFFAMDHANLSGKGLRVLVVDSHDDSSSLLKMLFADYGIETIVATGVNESLELMQQTCPDLLISEIMLPDGDGYSLISKVKALESAYGVSIPTIALTTCSKQSDRVHALAAGFSRHLTKPLDIDELMATVACVTGQPQTLIAEAC